MSRKNPILTRLIVFILTLMLILPSFGYAVFAADDDEPGQTGGQTTTDPVSSV
ncbi:MAG: hypothetical protein J5822_00640 [Eubacteriaceae bacterium]|nr:hypothetical protein [Eubacteriaceae bacterium]